MRRTLTGLTAFLVVTGGLLVVPVAAAPGPEAQPVDVGIDEVQLGSVTEPAAEALVTTDGEPEPGGVTEDEAAAVPSEPSAPPATTPPAAADETPADADGIASSGEELPGVPALTVSQPDTEQFSTVGVTWRQDELVDVVVQLRVKDTAGTWGEWTTLETDVVEQTQTEETEDHDVRGGTAPYWTGDARGIEVIVQGTDGVAPADVQVALVDPGTSDADALPTASAVQDQAHAGTWMPPVITRAQWGADESLRSWDPEYAPTIKAATLHHTADRNNYTAVDVPGMLRSIYAYHSLTRGWGDIGYNVIVDKFGRAFEGRYGGLASTVVGAHAGGFNTGTFGVSMLGNYADAATPQAMVDKVAALIGWKLSLYGVNPSGWTSLTSGGGGTAKYAAGTTVSLPTVFGHRDVGNTTCPGTYGYARLDEIRAKASQVYTESFVPQGSLDEVTPSFGKVTVRGWALDLNTPAQPIPVHVYVDGVPPVGRAADLDRPDIAASFPTAGRKHGFSVEVPVPAGSRQVCVYAINAGAGSSNPLLGCRTVAVPGFQPVPIGAFDSAGALGQRIGVAGWALDGSQPTQPVTVHAYLDGRYAAALDAREARPDIGQAFPGAGDAHGFQGSLAATPGDHTVCLYALNIGSGSTNPHLGCRTVSVPAAVHTPVGRLDDVVVDGRQVVVQGWVVDPDAPGDPGNVHVYVDGRFAGSVRTDVGRPDVANVFPGVGMSVQRGYRSAHVLHSGRHQICVYAINQGAGSDNPLLRCADVDMPAAGWNPIGAVDSVTLTGVTARVRGWALDFDAPDAPTQVHVYVDGAFRKAVPAQSSRPDVHAAFGAGSDHGLDVQLSLAPGTHSVCAYALNTGDGSTHPLLGCRTATVAQSAWPPYGVLDSATVTGGEVVVRGWAVDPDAPDRSVAVHVYVDGVGTALTANSSRPDVQSLYPAAGPQHGYEARVAVPPTGPPYTVCAYAIGVAGGAANVLLGCRPAT